MVKKKKQTVGGKHIQEQHTKFPDSYSKTFISALFMPDKMEDKKGL